MFKDTKMGETNSYTPIAQVVIEGMREFDESSHAQLMQKTFTPEQYDYIKSEFTSLIIKVLEAIEKEVGGIETFRCTDMGLKSDNYIVIRKSDLSDIQLLLNSTKEQIK